MAFTQISGNGLKNNSITNAHLHSGANIAASKLADSGVTAGTYGSASLIPAITVNAQGLVTSVSTNSFTTTDNNFTNALLSKLNGIAANANNYSLPTASSDTLGGIKVGTNLSISNGVLSATDTNTTYSVGDGGLTQKNFTTTLKNKLDGIAANATNVTNYVTNDASDTLTGGTYTFSSSTSQKIILSGATNPYIRFQEGTTNKAYLQWHGNDGYFLIVNQESGEYLRIGSGNNGLQFVVDGTARNVIHSNNVQSYALRTVGGTLSGSLTIGDGTNQARLLLKKQDNNVSDHIIFYNGTTRIGEIGCEDTSWLRINQETAKNIYTPRLIRADNGFQVDGNTVIDGSANHQVVGNCDIRFNNGTWSGNHCKIQHHSDYLYIVGGSNGIIFREAGTTRWFIDGSGHFIPNGTNNYNIGSSSNRVNNIYGGALFLGQASRYLSNASADYGSVQINGSGQNGWEGFSIDGRAVFMHNGSTSTGIYNDVNNEWIFYSLHNDYSAMYFNGSQKIKTENYGCKIAGTCRPHVTNGGDSGASDARWGTVYASNGSINTSDKNEKNTIIDSDLGLNFINKLKAVSYKWNDEELGKKTHYGLIAQDIEQTIKEIGKDVDNIGMIDKPEKGAMGLNYNELIAPLVKAIQELSTKVAALEAA
tara:strand:+ start:1451 stop:3400 length:1950 start_codon:yes stop_codon:yes gene_type:complete